jgi:hypothetical protein
LACFYVDEYTLQTLHPQFLPQRHQGTKYHEKLW